MNDIWNQFEHILGSIHRDLMAGRITAADAIAEQRLACASISRRVEAVAS